jgi:hypothetical protein
MVNKRGSNGKITAIFKTQMLLLKNGITVYSRIVLLNRYRSALISHAWSPHRNLMFVKQAGA